MKTFDASGMSRLELEPDHVIRYVITHINKNGMRTICGPVKGGNTSETPEEAQANLKNLIQRSSMEGELLAGVYGLPLEVRQVRCHPVRTDPMEIYFENEERMYPEERQQP